MCTVGGGGGDRGEEGTGPHVCMDILVDYMMIDAKCQVCQRTDTMWAKMICLSICSSSHNPLPLVPHMPPVVPQYPTCPL